ncbi:hypothetical protein BDV59DRAFT_188940 [Aspergillus ambiguus]|uniref:uncharacterized protein n=1 Tax=Aspergillus ambiguus TaxID=176160 RepID=UPI003CCE1636
MATSSDAFQGHRNDIPSNGNYSARELIFVCTKCYDNISSALHGITTFRTERKTQCLCCTHIGESGLLLGKFYSDRVERAYSMHLDIEEKYRELEKKRESDEW